MKEKTVEKVLEVTKKVTSYIAEGILNAVS